MRDGDPVRGKRAASESDSSQLLGDIENKEVCSAAVSSSLCRAKFGLTEFIEFIEFH